MVLEGNMCFPDDKEKDVERVGEDMNVVTWSRRYQYIYLVLLPSKLCC